MNTKSGRNEPCYCGSGKKYKRCHLALDESVHSAPPPTIEQKPKLSSEDDPAELAPGGSSQPGQFKNIGEVFKLAESAGLMKRNPELQRIFKENKTLLSYLGRQQEIEAAAAKLVPYEDEFQKFLSDEAACKDRYTMLFDEQPFADLRFTAMDVEKAFQKVGYPPATGKTEEIYKVYRDALSLLCSKEHRNELALQLLMRVPQYVEDNRFIDARVIVLFSDLTADERLDPNPFLSLLFYYGLEGWTRQRAQEQKTVFREMGLNVKQGMTPDEIDAFLAELRNDPVKTARLQNFVEANPEVRALSNANLELMDRNAVSLLDRKDACSLLLRAEELEPWAPFLMEKFQLMAEKHGIAEGTAPLPEAQRQEAFEAIYLPAMREVTKGIFTPERIRTLVGELKVYRQQLFDAGEKQAVFDATGAINYVEREDDPSLNVFLLSLCAKSVDASSSQQALAPG